MTDILPKVAIITRTKNRSLLLERCVRSVLAQTETDWLHVVVNDGGDPEAVNKIIANYHDKYQARQLLIHNPNSVGMEAASNIGIREQFNVCRGIGRRRYLAQTFLASSIARLESESWPETKGVFCYTQIVHEVIQDGEVREIKRLEFNRWLRGGIDLLQLMAWNCFTPVSFLFRRDALENVGLFDESLPVCGDWEFNIRFLSKFEIVILPETLAFWHQRPHSNGSYSNSVLGDSDLHHLYRCRLINRWFRESMTKGSLSLGTAFGLACILDEQKKLNDLNRKIDKIKKIVDFFGLVTLNTKAFSKQSKVKSQ